MKTRVPCKLMQRLVGHFAFYGVILCLKECEKEREVSWKGESFWVLLSRPRPLY